MNIQRLHASIKRHEGYRSDPYRDTRGFWTVGYGHLIHHNAIRQYVPHETLGNLLNSLSDTEAHERWFLQDVARSESDARRYAGTAWDALSDVRKEVLVEMAFQLGNRLRGFVRLLDAIQRGHWVQAEAEMLNSLWAKQTPSRVRSLASKMLEG